MFNFSTGKVEHEQTFLNQIVSEYKSFTVLNGLFFFFQIQACMGQIEYCCLSSSSPLWHVKIQIDKQNF